MSHDIPDGAICAECSAPLNAANVATHVEDVAEAPDGLPAPILLLVCRRCAAGQRIDVWQRNEFGEWEPSRPLRASWEWKLRLSDWLEDVAIPWLRHA